MNILFIHQSFPGQYCHILNSLAAQGTHKIVGMGLVEPDISLPSSITYVRYGLNRGNTPELHPWLLDFDSKFIRAEACANAALQLKKNGFTPNIICAHPGWGESIFLADIWPTIPILSYQEFFYNPSGFDYDFDAEFQSIPPSFEASAKLHLKNINPLLALHSSAWNVSPTHFQKSSYPSVFHSRFSVIHDGIDVHKLIPDPNINFVSIPNYPISFSGRIITFVNRRLEPYRGCHTFIRAIPYILDQNPDLNIVIIGDTSGASYGKQPANGNWHLQFLNEIDGKYDKAKVHFIGRTTYSDYIKLLQLSSCHVYLTYPFVLSWSLLEAMSTATPVVCSRTKPVLEVVQDGYNGLLFDFFKPKDLSVAVSTILSDGALSAFLGANARQSVIDSYSLDHCVPRHLSLIDAVQSRVLPCSL